LCSHNVHVQMCQTRSDGQSHADHAVGIHRVPAQEIEEGAVLVVVGNKPQLSPRPVIYKYKN
jgi:hypothetical protein